MLRHAVDRDDPIERDAQYRVAASVGPDIFDATLRRYAHLSQRARDRLPSKLGLVYDEISGSALDLFPAGEGAPLLLFIHGGYWRMLSRWDSAFMAESFVDSGVSVATIDYQLAPTVSLEEIVRQVRSAIAWLMNEGAAHGICADAIWATGSSAGGHLAAMAGATDWPLGHRLRGIFPVSGLFDLRPIARSFINEWLHLDEAAALRWSPSLISLPACPVLLAWGANEPDVFKAQSLDYYHRLLAAGVTTEIVEIPDRHHFDVILELADRDSSLFRHILSHLTGRFDGTKSRS